MAQDDSFGAHLTQLIENCQNYEEMPHRFDDSLIDRLIDSIQFDDNTFEVVHQLMRNVQFETDRSIPIQMIVRLVGAAVEHDSFATDDEQFSDFLARSQMLLNQPNRPHILIDNLFMFYTKPRVFESRKVDTWQEVVKFCLSQIGKSSTTVFVRRRYIQFLLLLTPSDARRFLVISGILSSFLMACQPGQQDNYIIDACTFLLDKYSDQLTFGECEAFVDAVRWSQKIGKSTLDLLVKLKIHRNGVLNVSLTPGAWTNELNRIDVICTLLETDDSSDEVVDRDDVNMEESNNARSTHQLIGLVIYSNACTLRHKTRILHRMNNTQVLDCLSQLKVEVTVAGIIAMSNVTNILPKLATRVSMTHIAELLEVLGERLLESPHLLKELARIYGNDVFKKPEFAKVKSQLKTVVTDFIRKGATGGAWEQTDTALELAATFPYFLLPDIADLEELGQCALAKSQPYVLCGVIKLLRDHFGGIPTEYLHRILLETADAPPKLICMEYLTSPDKFGTMNVNEIEEYLEHAFSDEDGGMQREALVLAEKALPKYRDRITDLLIEFKNNRKIGRFIKRLLHEDHQQVENTSISIIREMLASLNVAGNPDDVKDCY